MAKITIPTSGAWSLITSYLNSNFSELFGLTGWGAYTDTQYTAGSPFSLAANTDTVLPNNKGSIIETHKPLDVVTFYDGSVITGRNGDGLSLTLELKATPASGTNTYLEIWLDIGSGTAPVYPHTIPFVKGLTTYNLNVSYSAYTLSTWEANGAIVKVRSNTNCTIHGIRYILTRTSKAR